MWYYVLVCVHGVGGCCDSTFVAYASCITDSSAILDVTVSNGAIVLCASPVDCMVRPSSTHGDAMDTVSQGGRRRWYGLTQRWFPCYARYSVHTCAPYQKRSCHTTMHRHQTNAGVVEKRLHCISACTGIANELAVDCGCARVRVWLE